MRKIKNRRGGRTLLGALSLTAMLGIAGCDLDLTNPNAPTEEAVLTDIEGLIAHAVGMQAQFSSSVLAFVRAPALVTDEWSTRSPALAADNSLVTGEADRGFGVVSGPYTSAYRVIRSANNIIENAPNVGFGAGFEAGMVALARLYKAMALGMVIQQFEQVPLNAGVAGSPLQPREVVLQEILSELTQAREVLQQPNLDFSGFNSRVLGPGFNLHNTIDAMIARYSLMAGESQQAIAAAERVSPTVLSTFVYPNPDRNPIYNYSLELNYVAARQSFVDEAEEGDQRTEFWVDTESDPPAPSGAVGIPLYHLGQYTERNDAYPVYLPGEMLLIRAEAHARLNQLEQARQLINQVRTQCPDDTALEEPAACLPPLSDEELATQDDILRQIAYERRYELFMQGLRWEDMRRLGEYIDDEPSMMWLPIPQQECAANPAVNCPGF